MDDNNMNYLILKCLEQKNIRGHDVSTYYKGTFAANQIDHLMKFNFKKSKFFSFIVNTLSTTDSGIGHWLAIIIDYRPQINTLVLRFFDSLGVLTYLHISKFINKIQEKCKIHQVKYVFDFMKKPLQAPTSKLCGVYVAYCIIKSWRKENTLQELFKNFKNNRLLNDQKMIKFLYANWPNKTCHDFAIYSNVKTHIFPRAPPFCPKCTLDLNTCFDNCKCNQC